MIGLIIASVDLSKRAAWGEVAKVSMILCFHTGMNTMTRLFRSEKTKASTASGTIPGLIHIRHIQSQIHSFSYVYWMVLDARLIGE